VLAFLIASYSSTGDRFGCRLRRSRGGQRGAGQKRDGVVDKIIGHKYSDGEATMAEEASSVSSIRAILKDPDRLHVAQRSGKKSCKSGGVSKPSSQTEAHRCRSSSTANRNTRAISPPKAEVYHTSRRFQQGRKISSFDPIMPTDRCFNRDWRAGLPAARISPTSGCSAQQTGRGCASWIAASRR
jgi:hypothetical protein